MAEDPLEVGRHHERCCRLIDAQAVESRSGLEVRGHEELATGDEYRRGESNGDGVVERRAHEEAIRRAEIPDRELVVDDRSSGSFVEDAVGDRLGHTRRPRGEVHRSREGDLGNVHRCVTEERGECSSVLDAVRVAEDGSLHGAFSRREAWVHHRRSEPRSAGAENCGQQVDRTRQAKGHDVPVAQAGGGSETRGCSSSETVGIMCREEEG